VRPLLALALAAALSFAAAADAAPQFAPNPRQAFEGFVGINPPRVDVPVGALWIDGYGPTGEGAQADNLETVRSLNALTIDKNFQLSLSIGLLDLLGVDPKARSHYVARFTDLTIVRVKDIARVAGPQGEPRILEALKAGSVIVSSDAEIGLNGQSIAWAHSPADGSGTADRTKSYSIEARDMFIAVHVATSELTRSKERELRLGDDGKARIDEFLIVASRPSCPAPAVCRPELGITKLNSQTPVSTGTTPLDPNGELRLNLPVPVSDGAGGLFSRLAVRWIDPCSKDRPNSCGKEPKISVHYEGTRVKDLNWSNVKGW